MAPLGNLVRLHPLHINELPVHPLLESLLEKSEDVANSGNPSEPAKVVSTERPNLFSFMEEILDQATLFVDETLPNTFAEGALKKSPPSEAQVRILNRSIGKADIQSVPWVNSNIPRNWTSNGRKPAETWFARRSRHRNQCSEGTADLEEFDFGLRCNHSKHEQDYTPDVVDSYKVLDWDAQIKIAIPNGSNIDNYNDMSMSIFEMCHRLPTILSNRAFPVLVVTARRGKHSFIIVQIPVHISNLTAAFYSNGRNTKEGDTVLIRKKPIIGAYTSIESCQMLPDQDVEWVMATASNAEGSLSSFFNHLLDSISLWVLGPTKTEGWLPLWIQKIGVPSAIAKDVGFFFGWIAKRRNSAL